MNTDNYFYELCFDAATINAVKESYSKLMQHTYQSGDLRSPHCDLKYINDILTENNILSNLIPFLSGTGIELTLAPNQLFPIHIDQIDIIDSPGTIRNIALNFPIRMCDSITSFYPNPPLRTRRPHNHYSDGIYLKEPTPICSFQMGEQAVLFNTRVYHSARNLSQTQTRTMVGFSFDIKYSMADCIEIMRNLGYAK